MAKKRAAKVASETLAKLRKPLSEKPLSQSSEAEREKLFEIVEKILRQHEVEIPDWLESLGLPRDTSLAAQVALADTFNEFATSADVEDIPLDNLIELIKIDTASKTSAQRLRDLRKLEGEVRAGARVEPLKQPKTRRSTRRCEGRDNQFVA